MAAYINDRKQIAFARPLAKPTGWPVLRGDVYDGGVGFDVTGLCLLDADECRELALWLVVASDTMPKNTTPKPIKRVEKTRRREMTPDDYECRTCHQGMMVPDGMDPLEPEVRYCTDCMVSELERLQTILGRINHFATGACDMPSKIRLRCIAKESSSV